MSDKPAVVVWCPCYGAPEIQAIQNRLSNTQSSLLDKLRDNYGQRNERGEWEFLTEDEDGEVAFLNSPEAVAAVESYELSEQALQACFDALAPINAVYIEAQDKAARARGFHPSWEEAYSVLSDRENPVDLRIYEADGNDG